MKHLIIFIAVNSFVINIYSQVKLNESSIPTAVKTKFAALYPNTVVEFWTKEENNYVAEFSHQKKEMILFIEPTGQVVKVETRITPAELPAAAKAYIAKNYAGEKITDAVKTTDHKGKRIYEAEVKEMDLVFDATGKFMKSVKERPID